VALLGGAPLAGGDVPARCLTPEVGRVLGDLVAAGGLQRALGTEFVVASGQIGGDRIELRIQDRDQVTYALALALPESTHDHPDGIGRRFAFYVDTSSNPMGPSVKAALLAVAAIVDQAIPDTAFQQCSQPGAGRANEFGSEHEPAVQPPARSDTGPAVPDHGPHRYPRVLALAGAMGEIVILTVAIVFGTRALAAIAPLPGPDGRSRDSS
jgi:hypothetical protein